MLGKWVFLIQEPQKSGLLRFILLLLQSLFCSKNNFWSSVNNFQEHARIPRIIEKFQSNDVAMRFFFYSKGSLPSFRLQTLFSFIKSSVLVMHMYMYVDRYHLSRILGIEKFSFILNKYSQTLEKVNYFLCIFLCLEFEVRPFSLITRFFYIFSKYFQ